MDKNFIKLILKGKQMKNGKLIIIMLLLIPSNLFTQDWKKVIKNKTSKQINKIEKKITQEIKPLDINFKINSYSR